MKKKTPMFLGANGLWNYFTGRKKYQITCGECSHTYKDKVPFSLGGMASSICPCCHSQNVWSHAEWENFYEQSFNPRG